MVETNPSPKSVLLSDPKKIEAQRTLVQNAVFSYGVDAALMQYQRFLCNQPVESQEAAASHYRMEGALQFVAVLKGLAEMPQIQKPQNIAALDHKA